MVTGFDQKLLLVMLRHLVFREKLVSCSLIFDTTTIQLICEFRHFIGGSTIFVLHYFENKTS